MKKIMLNIFTAFTGGAIALGAYTVFGPSKIQYQIVEKESPKPLYSSYIPNSENNIDFTNAAENSVNAVVHIKTVASVQTRQYADPFEQFFFGSPFGNPQRQMPRMGSGSGVIISDDGYIITNNHVVFNAEQIEVTLNNKKTYTAKIVGTDPNTDLAVIKIDETNLPTIPFGNSNELRLGEWVLAVGNPFNLTSTVTAGIVSATGRNIDIIRENYKIESFIQTDAVVNPGNSGGALVNTRGELVGINTAIQSHTGSFEGYSFAIPANLARKIAQDIIEFGSPQRGLLGVNIRDIDSKFAKERSISNLDGVWVDGVLEGSAGAEGGIQKGDIILKINDIDINSAATMQENLGMYRPGDVLHITILRDDKELVKKVKLKNVESSVKTTASAAEVNKTLGASFEKADAKDLKKLGLSNGVVVKEVTNGKMRIAGIRPGFIITEANGKKVDSVEDLLNSFNNKKGFFTLTGKYPTGEKVIYSFN